MGHVRAQIREVVRTNLTEIPGLENSVLIDSDRIPDDLELALVQVLLGNEDISARTIAGANGRKLSRELEMNIDVYSRAVTESILQAEDYAADIEAKLTADPRMKRLVMNLSLRAYTIERSDEGSQPISRLRMQWFVTYFTNERDATVPA